MDLTQTQQAILQMIAERIDSEGMPPSQTEIARAFGFKGVRAAQYHLEALEQAGAIAAHPRVQSVSFGLMDFVSAHGGAIPASAMASAGQFTHPLVLRAKVEISAACHAAGITPSHGVVTEFKDTRALLKAATKAARELAYTRMWSIHPGQIPVILDAFTPVVAEVDDAVEILTAAQAEHWAPISHHGVLHDRASYRHHWYVLERAWLTGQPLPAEIEERFFSEP